MPDVAILDAKIAEAEKAIAEGETTGEKRRAMERREDLMRLKRVEQIYVRTYHPLHLSDPYLTIATERCSASSVRMGACFAQASAGNGVNREWWPSAPVCSCGGLPAGRGVA